MDKIIQVFSHMHMYNFRSLRSHLLNVVKVREFFLFIFNHMNPKWTVSYLVYSQVSEIPHIHRSAISVTCIQHTIFIYNCGSTINRYVHNLSSLFTTIIPLYTPPYLLMVNQQAMYQRIQFSFMTNYMERFVCGYLLIGTTKNAGQL